MHPLSEPIYVCIYKHSTFYYIFQHIARFAFKLKTKKLNKKKTKDKRCHTEQTKFPTRFWQRIQLSLP